MFILHIALPVRVRFDFSRVPKHFAVAVLHWCFCEVTLRVGVRLREVPVAAVCLVAVNAFAFCYIRHYLFFLRVLARYTINCSM
jgi:hypothetical protein